MNAFIIKIFKASDNLEECKRFMRGHSDVLKEFGISKLTSADEEWFYHKNTYVITVDSLETGEMVGGIRAQIADRILPLPMEKAISEKDSRVFKLVENLIDGGTGEICGLWNSRKIKGFGLSTILMKSIIVILPQLNLSTFLGLCAPWTFQTLKDCGYTVIKSLGNSGTFYYPKEDLVATAIMIKDTNKLLDASSEFKDWIFDLRESLKQVRIDKPNKIPLELHFDLEIKTKKNVEVF